MRNILLSGEERKSGGAGTCARESRNCPFTRLACDGGTIYQDGSLGCGFKESPDSECSWMADVPDGQSPRDFYNELSMEALK